MRLLGPAVVVKPEPILPRMEGRPKPWWEDNAELKEFQRRSLAELLGEGDERQPPPVAAEPDPVLAEILSGATWRELGEARDDLVRARERYAAAVRSARTAGLSWGEIGRVLGVSRQQLHRRFSRPPSA